MTNRVPATDEETVEIMSPDSPILVSVLLVLLMLL